MLEWNSIHNMDCLTGLSQLPEQSVHLAFADPPFNIGYDYDVYHDQRGADDYLNWCREWLTAVLRVLRPDGTFWLAIGDEYAAELKVMMQRELGLTCRSWVIWYYTFGVNCKMKFSRSHAHLFHMVRAPAQFTFNVDSIRVPSARQLVYGDKRANPKGRLPDDTWILRPQDLPEGFQADGVNVVAADGIALGGVRQRGGPADSRGGAGDENSRHVLPRHQVSGRPASRKSSAVSSGAGSIGAPCRLCISTPVIAPAVMRSRGSSGDWLSRVARAPVITSMVSM